MLINVHNTKYSVKYIFYYKNDAMILLEKFFFPQIANKNKGDFRIQANCHFYIAFPWS